MEKSLPAASCGAACSEGEQGEEGELRRGPLLYRGPAGGRGDGVFAGEAIASGARVLVFEGPLLTKDEIPDEDRCIQVAAAGWLGPSGGLDDLVNHSCEPNCGLRLRGERLLLVAIRNIKEGEEITFDYSTSTNHGDGWMMACLCTSKRCRGVVRDFDLLPEPIKRRYHKLDIVPGFISTNGHVPKRARPPRRKPLRAAHDARST